MKRTQLTRKTPLARGDSQLKRTPLARGDSQLDRRSRLKQVSDKRRGEQPERAAVRAETLARAGYQCQLRYVVPEVRCWHPAGEPLDVDEIAGRGVAPGSHLDSRVTLAVCRAHHDWRHDHPAEAAERGVRITGGEYEQMNDPHEFVPTTTNLCAVCGLPYGVDVHIKPSPRPGGMVAAPDPAWGFPEHATRSRSPVADMMAAQDAAAARFEQQTGRKSTDPSPMGTAKMIMINGRMVSITSGYDQPYDPDQVDHFARHGKPRVHINTDGTVVRGAELLPDEVRIRLQQGDRADVRQITAALLQGMFGTPERAAEEIAHMNAVKELRARSIDTEVVDEG